MVAHGDQVVLSHTNLLLSSTGLEPAWARSMDSLQDSKVGSFPQSCVQYSMMSVLSIFLFLWWGITGLPSIYGAFLKITTIFFPF